MAKRYIDADALKNEFCEACSTHKRYYMTVEECRARERPDRKWCFKMRLIDNSPTADVVEVVRCSECKYKDDCARQMVHTTRDYVLEQNISTYNKVDFCSCGERRTDDD